MRRTRIPVLLAMAAALIVVPLAEAPAHAANPAGQAAADIWYNQHGEVKWWNNDKGYGLITPMLGGEDVFFSFAVIVEYYRAPQQGERVEYDVFKGGQRPVATRVLIRH